MAVCLIAHNPSETAEQFQRVMTHLDESGPRATRRSDPADRRRRRRRLRAISIWDSADSLERFWTQRLEPAYQAAGVAPQNTTREIFQIHSLIQRTNGRA